MAFNYLEIIETLTEEEAIEKKPQFIRVEVIDKAEAELKSKDYKPLFESLKYKSQFAIHNHGKGGKNKPCEIEIIKEIK